MKVATFNGDKTALYWKNMPSGASIAREKSMPGFRGQGRELVTTLKPVLIYHSENARVLNNYAKCTLPVEQQSLANNISVY